MHRATGALKQPSKRKKVTNKLSNNWDFEIKTNFENRNAFLSMLMFTDRQVRYQHGKGPCNVFILDTSLSLGIEGFIQMRKTFSTIIDGNFKFLYKDEKTMKCHLQFYCLYLCHLILNRVEQYYFTLKFRVCKAFRRWWKRRSYCLWTTNEGSSVLFQQLWWYKTFSRSVLFFS